MTSYTESQTDGISFPVVKNQITTGDHLSYLSEVGNSNVFTSDGITFDLSNISDPNTLTLVEYALDVGLLAFNEPLPNGPSVSSGQVNDPVLGNIINTLNGKTVRFFDDASKANSGTTFVDPRTGLQVPFGPTNGDDVYGFARWLGAKDSLPNSWTDQRILWLPQIAQVPTIHS